MNFHAVISRGFSIRALCRNILRPRQLRLRHVERCLVTGLHGYAKFGYRVARYGLRHGEDRMNLFRRGLCLLALLTFGTTLTSRAQTANGTIAGTIVDSTGAAIPGATVVATNIQTGI